jgi:alpha/beta superfamily hydrolase
MGWPVLRFNFRGVGLSEGEFEGGSGEAGDVRAALDWLAGERPGLPLVVCGFSFGNAVGLPVGAADERVSHLVGLGTPTDRFPFDRLAGVDKPKLFVQGDRDEFGPLEELRAGLTRVARPWDLVVIEGADHFFAGHLEEVQAAIVDWFGS